MKRVAFVILVLLSAILHGCLFREPLRVGFVGPMTGKFSDLGVHGRNGALLGAETVNAQGGVHGRSVELIPLNDRGTVDGALEAVQNLIRRDVRIIVGPMTSTQTKAILPIVEQTGGVCISPTASSHTLDGVQDALFRLSPSDRFQVDVLAKRMVLDRHIRSLVILWDEDNETFAKAHAEAVARAFVRRGGIVSAQRPFRSSDGGSWDLWAMQVRQIGPDGVMVVASAKDTATFCQFLALHGVRIPVFTTFWARSPDLLLYGGRTVEGVEMVSAGDLGAPTPAMQDFMNLYRNRFGKHPNHAAVLAYEALLLLSRALEQSLSQDLPLRNTLIADHGLSGPNGPLRLDPYGDRSLPCVVESVSLGRFTSRTEIGNRG